MSIIKIDPVRAAPKLEDYQIAIQSLIDDTAREKQFNDGVTMASYVASTNAEWASQASIFVAWRDDVWAHSYASLEEFEQGEMPQPSVASFIQTIPKIVWPEQDVP